MKRGEDGSSEHDGAGPMSLTRPRRPIRGRVALLAVAYALLVLLQRSAEATSLSLFLDHLGAKRLPETFVVVSLIDVPLAFAYMYLARHLNRRWFLVGMGGALVGVLGGARLLSLIDPGLGLFVAYLGAATLGTFLVIHWGVLLLDAFTIDESRRAFPLVYAGGHVGSFLAGAAMQLAGAWTVQDLLLAIPGASLMGLAVMMVLLGRQTEGRTVRRDLLIRPNAAAGAKAWKNLGLLSSSPLLRAIAVSTVLMVLLRLCLRYLYGHELETAFSTPDTLARFVGQYTMIASVIGMTLQLFATPRLLRLLGVGKLNLAYSGAVLLSIVGLLGAPGIYAATGARFADLELKDAIKTPLSAMFYDALGYDQRADARAIVLGIVSPFASLGSSLLLVVYSQVHAPVSVLGWAALVVGVAYLVLSWWQAHAYRTSLHRQLLDWAREATADPNISIDQAVEAARRCEDLRIVDMAREIRRRRRSH